MAERLDNFIQGKWQGFDGAGIPQYNTVNGNLISTVNGDGMDFAPMLDYARKVGNRQLRQMTFLERGLMLKKLALFLHKNRKKYYPISYQSGATKTDSWIDICLLYTSPSPRD